MILFFFVLLWLILNKYAHNIFIWYQHHIIVSACVYCSESLQRFVCQSELLQQPKLNTSKTPWWICSILYFWLTLYLSKTFCSHSYCLCCTVIFIWHLLYRLTRVWRPVWFLCGGCTAGGKTRKQAGEESKHLQIHNGIPEKKGGFKLC